MAISLSAQHDRCSGYCRFRSFGWLDIAAPAPMAGLGAQYVSVWRHVRLFWLFRVLSHFCRGGWPFHRTGFGDVHRCSLVASAHWANSPRDGMSRVSGHAFGAQARCWRIKLGQSDPGFGWAYVCFWQCGDAQMV